MAYSDDSRSIVLRRRTFALASGALLLSGCFGSFAATNALYDWNVKASDNKWLRWLVFLVLVIVPVYGLFILADALVINTIEFFSGNNPVSHANLGNGYALTTSPTPDPKVVKHEIEKDGKVERTLYVRRQSEHELLLLDEHMRVTGHARILPDGRVEVLDGDGRVIKTITREQKERADAAMDNGASPSQAFSAAVS
jgi:hypothetical protein